MFLEVDVHIVVEIWYIILQTKSKVVSVKLLMFLE